MNDNTTIDAYLDALADHLNVSPRSARRILAETADHLHSARQELIDSGLEPAVAESEALSRFGPPEVVARGFNRHASFRLLPFSEAVAIPLLGLLAAGLLAIGLSGVLAFAIGQATGKDFIAGDLPGVTYTAERCTDFFEYHAEAPNCATAATAHHYDEVVYQRLDAGILGLIMLAAYFAALRLRHPSRLPRLFAPTIGAAVFVLAGCGFTLMALGPTVTGESDGAGAFLSAGIVSLAFGAVFGLRLLPLLTPAVDP
jgi:hypothetical protein